MKRFFAIAAAVMAISCIFASCEKNEGNGEPKGYTLTVDKSEINAGESVTFTVTDPDNKDVSAEFVVCEVSVGTCYSGMTVILEDAGEFEFEAHKLEDQNVGCENTVKVTVKAVEE